MDKDAFFAATKLKETTYTIPGSDVVVTLRELSVADRSILFEQRSVGPELAGLTVALSCPDFTAADAEKLMAEVNAETLMAMSEKVFLLSGISEEGAEDAKKD